MHINNIKFERNSFLEYYQMTYIVMTFNIQAIEVYCLFIKNILLHLPLVIRLAELLKPIQIPSSVMTFAVICKWTMIRATTFPQFMEQFCSLIKTRLWMTANVITDEGIWIGSKSSAKLLTSGWCRRIFL